MSIDFDIDEAVASSFEFLEGLEPIIAVIAGYKAKLMNAGMSEEIAEEMCVTMHDKIIESSNWNAY